MFVYDPERYLIMNKNSENALLVVSNLSIDGFDRLGGVPGNEKSHFHPDLHK